MLKARDERQREIGGIEHMIDVVILVRRLRDDMLNGYQIRVVYGNSSMVM